MSYLAVHAVSLIALLLVWYSAGYLAERAVFTQPPVPAYLHQTRWLLGVGTWIALLFAAAAAGVLTRPLVVAASIGSVAGAVVSFAMRAERTGPSTPRSRSDSLHRWWVNVPAWAVLAVVFAAFFVQCLRPSPAWDATTYHLTLPRRYLEHGGFFYVPFNVYSNWPLNVELLFAQGMALHDYLLATLVHLAFAGLIVHAMVSLGRTAGVPAAGPLAGCVFLANQVVQFEAGVAYVDLALAWFFLLAVIYLAEAHRTPAVRRHALLLAGIAAGLMAGVKLIGASGLAIVVAIHLWLSRREGATTQNLRESLRLLAAPGAIIALPWFLKTLWYTGNPIYPFLFGALRGTEWNRRLGEQLTEWQQTIGMGRGIRDYLLLPWRVVMEGGPGYHRFDGSISRLWLALAPLTALAGAVKVPARTPDTTTDVSIRVLGGASGLYFCCWAASSQQARFLIPALATLSAAAGLTLARLCLAAGRRYGRSLSLAASLLLAVHLRSASEGVRDDALRWLPQYAQASEMLASAVPPIFQFVNRELPRDAQLLFLNTNMGFFCLRPYQADSFFEASQINAFLLRGKQPREILDTLRARGITHLLVGHDRWGIPYPPSLEQLLADDARLIYRSPQDDLLYVLLP